MKAYDVSDDDAAESACAAPNRLRVSGDRHRFCARRSADNQIKFYRT